MEIKFRGKNINGAKVYGLLTKKKIRTSGEMSWAIATGKCTAGETIPVDEKSIAQLVGYDSTGAEIYSDDIVIDSTGAEIPVEELINKIKIQLKGGIKK